MPTHRDSELFLHHLPQTLEEPSHLQDGAHSTMNMETLMCERASYKGVLYPALTQSVCLRVLCACLCVHHMPVHVCACMYLTQRMEPRVSGMLDNWATSTSAFSAMILLSLLRQAFTVLPRLASNFDPPAEPPQKLELQMCTTMPGLPGFFN